MKKHKSLSYLIISIFLLFAKSAFSQTESTPPNFVLILVDDAALQDFGCYGGEASTPHIDALAGRGIMFTNHHASPMCAPSRAMLLTGHDSHQTGVPNLPIFTPPQIAAYEGYEGILNNKVFTIATRLKNHGYHTYTSGKWHLGHTQNTLPTKRGFDRSYILDASGADNYEQRPYLPTQEAKPPWYKDGKTVDLPEDFYSSRNLVDEMIQFMKETPKDDKPFFSYLAFQAIHIPVQAPREITKKYISTYEKGWAAIKKRRYENAKKIGIISPSAPLGEMLPTLENWEDLTEEDKKYKAKAMAVNAAMLESMDTHIGRYITYLKSVGKYQNTMFVITSDNGPEASAVGDVAAMKIWLKTQGYHQDYERLGEQGSFNYIGPEFASAAAGPSSYFKFYAGEGGLRVPLIFSGPQIPKGDTLHSFTWITDITPTILSLAGIDIPKIAPVGPMTGKNLTPLLRKEVQQVYETDDIIGMEAAGQCALYKGDLKLVRNGKPYGDGIWRMYNLNNDPGETIDLKESEPSIFASMIKHYDDYTTENNVVEMGINYQPLLEIQNKYRAMLGKTIRPWFLLIFGLIFGFLFWKKMKS
tara:strand:- start:1206 stop:2963 length:1758 start_codon:yes stop_codon:yes gene_type:complete